MRTLGLFLILSSFTACKQPMENPEQADPIFQDMEEELKNARSERSTEKKDLAETRKTLAELPAHDATKGQTVRAVKTHEDRLVQFEQKVTYYEVRSEQRKEYDKKVYAKRFEKDLPWPDMDEAREYKEMKKLRTVSRNWDDRVPKTTRYNKQEPAKAEKPKAEHE